MEKIRTIITNGKTYVLPVENEGMAIEDVWPEMDIPDSLKGARVYQTEDGVVIAEQIEE